MPRDKPLTIITINFNNANGLRNTFKSVSLQDKDVYELVVIDGGSTDDSLEIIEQYSYLIDHKVSETDYGIFDAMNKGIKYATSEWLFFLNSGDELLDLNFSKIDFSRYLDKRILYGDVLHFRNSRPFKLVCDHKRGILNHQAMIYRKDLHNEFGYYNSGKNFKIADYFFFCQLNAILFQKVDLVFTKAQPGGVSENANILQYRSDVDFFYGKKKLPKYIFDKIKFLVWQKMKPFIGKYRHYHLNRHS